MRCSAARLTSLARSFCKADLSNRIPCIVQSLRMEETKNEKILLVFDFDHTLIDNNCDTYIYKLAPGGKIPDSLKSLYRKDGWTHYMAEIFKYLHENGVTKEDIFKCLSEIQLTNGMEKLLNSMPKGKSECIIISDANSVFIDHILLNFGVQHHFRKVFTNPAKFNDEGCLTIEMYHLQNWCTLSTKNLCKGHILANYIKSREKENVTFSSIGYVGDGVNDFCPSLRLQECDLVFPRRGYSLMQHIPKMEAEQNLKVKADIYPWEMGKDILDRILSRFDNVGSTKVPVPRLCIPFDDS